MKVYTDQIKEESERVVQGSQAAGWRSGKTESIHRQEQSSYIRSIMKYL